MVSKGCIIKTVQDLVFHSAWGEVMDTTIRLTRYLAALVSSILIVIVWGVLLPIEVVVVTLIYALSSVFFPRTAESRYKEFPTSLRKLSRALETVWEWAGLKGEGEEICGSIFLIIGAILILGIVVTLLFIVLPILLGVIQSP